jgi:hypothetical protein
MIFTIQRRGILRVWVNSVPDALLIGSRQVHGCLKKGRLFPEIYSLAVEWKLPHGGIASYGLLGGTITAQEPPNVRVNCTESDGQPFEAALIRPPADEATISLPEEFAKAAVKGIVHEVDRIGGLMNVQILINIAASGVVGSSSKHFEKLGKVFVSLLSLSSEPTVQEIESKLPL